MTFNLNAYREWFQKRRQELHLSPFTAADKPTMKSILFLAFLETENRECSYDDLISLIVSHGVAKAKDIQRDSLRVGVRDLVKALANTPFRIVRIGKGKFQLAKSSRLPSSTRVFTSIPLDHPLGSPDELVRNVILRRVLPFHSLYYFPESAASWANYSREEEGKKKAQAAADAWKNLQMNCVVSDVKEDGVLSVVGLAVGDGQGEIALLKKILNDKEVEKEIRQVNYLAVDFSPCLLLHHAQNLTMTFREEISNGRLVCATVLGDIFDLKDSRSKWNAITRSRKMISNNFLPWSSPMLVTYLGNCMGNGEEDSERKFLELIQTRLGENIEDRDGAGTVRCLIGVAIDKGHEDYFSNWYDFLLQGLQRLVRDELIKNDDGPAEEVFKPRQSAKAVMPAEVKLTEVKPAEYSGTFGLKGKKYVFEHVMESGISAPVESDSQQVARRVPKDGRIKLYTIVKYDMKTMLKFLWELGFEAMPRIGIDDTHDGSTDDPENFSIRREITAKKNQRRHYGMFCVRPRTTVLDRAETDH